MLKRHAQHVLVQGIELSHTFFKQLPKPGLSATNLQKLRAAHRRQGERLQERNEHRDRNRYAKLKEKFGDKRRTKVVKQKLELCCELIEAILGSD